MHRRADFSTWATSGGKSKKECILSSIRSNVKDAISRYSFTQHDLLCLCWKRGPALAPKHIAMREPWGRGAPGKSRDTRVPVFVKLGHD